MKKVFVVVMAIVAGICIFGSQNADAISSVKPLTINQPLGGFCCDVYGNRRCVIVNPIPVGNVCFCPNQGYGTVCY